jgi:uncharacterized protein involved in type VI secretion and phage assembly
MSKSLYKALAKTARRQIKEDGRWVHGESAIVVDNDDPERRHRIKVAIPSIDEDMVFDQWVSPASPFSMGDGFGSVHIPEIGSEVLLDGTLGQKYNFTYKGSVYNEEAATPEELGPDTPGVKVPKNYAIIATLLAKIQSLEDNIELLAQKLAKIEAENIEITATERTSVTGQDVDVTAEQTITHASNQIELNADGSIDINSGTCHIASNGAVSVNGTAITIAGTANVNITAGAVLKLEGRTVNKVGPPI